MEDEAKELAATLIRSGESEYTGMFTHGNYPGEAFVVVAVRVKESTSQQVIQAIKSVAKPAGRPCPTCGGTGRV
jgi:hypothetical protein